AAPDMAAGETQAQVHPGVAHLQALFAAVGPRLDVADLMQMRARRFRHRSLLLSSSGHSITPAGPLALAAPLPDAGQRPPHQAPTRMLETLSQQKSLPHSEESERAVLGGVMLDPA